MLRKGLDCSPVTFTLTVSFLEMEWVENCRVPCERRNCPAPALFNHSGPRPGLLLLQDTEAGAGGLGWACSLHCSSRLAAPSHRPLSTQQTRALLAPRLQVLPAAHPRAQSLDERSLPPVLTSPHWPGSPAPTAGPGSASRSLSRPWVLLLLTGALSTSCPGLDRLFPDGLLPCFWNVLWALLPGRGRTLQTMGPGAWRGEPPRLFRAGSAASLVAQLTPYPQPCRLILLCTSGSSVPAR